MGDILSDLPNVTSFGIAEARHYQKGGPKTPLQLWLRRDPPAWQASREQRARAADAAMAEMNAHLSEQLRQLAGCRSFCEMVVDLLQSAVLSAPRAVAHLRVVPVQVGRSVMCKKGSTDTREGGATEVYFSQQTFRKVMEAVLAAHPQDKAALEQEWAASEAALAHTVGAHVRALTRCAACCSHDPACSAWTDSGSPACPGPQILQEAADAVMASGPLRDHRPLYPEHGRLPARLRRAQAQGRQLPRLPGRRGARRWCAVPLSQAAAVS